MKNNHIENLQKIIIGKTINHTWRGYGSAIFFELGELSFDRRLYKDGNKFKNPAGEITIMVEWDWRVESLRSIKFGSANSARKIDNEIKKLVGLSIVDFQFEGRISELYITLTKKRWIKTCSVLNGQPQWAIIIRDKRSEMYGSSYSMKNGSIYKEAIKLAI